jgi:hypothetical protein
MAYVASCINLPGTKTGVRIRAHTYRGKVGSMPTTPALKA